MTRDGVKRSHVGGIVLLIMLIVGPLSGAETASAGQVQEASIIGQVTDESGAVLPGVTVTTSSPALQVKQVVDVTNARGEYRLTPLPLGTYTVEYTISGFQTLRREELRLTAGFVAKVDVVLKLQSVEETVTVSGQSPVVDVTNTATRTTLTQEVLEAVPTGRNGLTALMSLAPSVRGTPDFGGFLETPVFGAFGQDNNAWVLIEGVAAGSLFSSSDGISNHFDSEAVEEASVQTLNSTAENPTSGIQVSVITKSGGNVFHGGGFVSQFSQWMQSNNVNAALAAQGFSANKVQERWDREGGLGGPVMQDKLWFYFSGRLRKDATPILGLVTPEGSPGVRPVRQVMATGKISYQLSALQKLIGVHSYSQVTDQAGSDINNLYDWDSRVSEGPVTVKISKLEWQIAKGKIFASVQAGAWRVDSGPYAGFTDKVSTTDQITSRVTGLGDKVGVANVDYGRYDARGKLDWYKPGLFIGNHEFKTGFNYGSARGDRGRLDRGAGGNYQLIFRNAVPFQISAKNYPVTPHSRLNYFASFLQDSWTINRRLTLNLGVRYAHDDAFIPEQCREAAPPPFRDLYSAECFSKVQYNIWTPIVPRLHFAYDVTGKGTTVIKGGWGRFANMHTEDELLLASRNVDFGTVYRWHDLNGDKLYQPGEADLDLNGPDFVSRKLPSGDLTGLVQNPDLKEPGSNEFTLSFERQLMRNFAIRGTGIYSKTINALRVENTLRPYGAYNIPITNPDPGPDGKIGTADDPGTFITYYDYPASLAGAAFQRPMFINNDRSNARFISLEIAATKRLSSRWQLMASYSATKVHVPYVSDLGIGSSKVVQGLTSYNPNAEINAENNTWEWQTRLSGSYLFPADVQASANFENRSGEPWARTVSFTGGKQIPSILLAVEPIGTRRVESLNLLTLRGEKSFHLRAGHRVAVRAQVYNVLNVATPTSSRGKANLIQQSGPNFMRSTAISTPRIGEVALTYAF